MNLRNSPDAIIKDLLAEINRMETVIERLQYRNRNQKQEIRRLNNAHISKNNILNKMNTRLQLISDESGLKALLNTPSVLERKNV
jgi:hypothetical protein